MLTLSDGERLDTSPHPGINNNGIGLVSSPTDPSIEFPSLGVLRSCDHDHGLRFLELEPREDILQIQLLVASREDLAELRDLGSGEEHVV